MLIETRKIDRDHLYSFCNGKNSYACKYCTGMTCEQYENLFEMCGEYTTERFEAMAHEIFDHSNNDFLKDARENYTPEDAFAVFAVELYEYIVITMFHVEAD